MDMMITCVVGVVIAVALGGTFGLWIGQRLGHARAQSTWAEEKARLAVEQARVEAAAEAARLALVEREKAQAGLQRELEERGNAEARSRSEVLQVLAPISARLKDMHDAVAQMEKERAGQYGALDEQMKWAREANRELSAATQALGEAMRSGTSRGTWGEAQLRNIVEAAGLVEKVDFDVQVVVDAGDRRGRPDMIVRLPGGKSLPVDAKVPFDAYWEAASIPAEATGQEGRRRAELMKAHVRALRGHVDALADRRYWEGMEAPDLVVAFVPSESLLSAALAADPTLLEYSFGKNVALVSPVSLWSVLRSIEHAWRQQLVSEQAKEILDLSCELYRRLAKLGEHAEKMRKAVEDQVKAWNSFAGSLESRVMVTARKLARLEPTVTLPELAPVEASVRVLGH